MAGPVHRARLERGLFARTVWADGADDCGESARRVESAGGRESGKDHVDSSGLNLFVARHFGDEALVEFLGGVVAGSFEFGLEGGDFDEAGEVAARADRNRDVWNVDVKDL